MSSSRFALILFIVAIILLVVWCLSYGQEGWQIYDVPNFLGGINVSGDSTNLQPNEALAISNMTLDMPNCLSARQGYSAWNDTAMSNREIDEIIVYQPVIGTRRMVVACDSAIYINTNLTDPTTENWAGKRLRFGNSGIKVTNGSTEISRTTNQWWLTRLHGLEILKVVGDTSAKEYRLTIPGEGAQDSTITISPAYAGATNASAACTIYYQYFGRPFMFEDANRLYIFDPDAAGYYSSIVYNDTAYWHLALIDSGLVSDTIDLDTTQFVFNEGRAHIEHNWPMATFSDNVNFEREYPDSTIAVGDIIEISIWQDNGEFPDLLMPFSAKITEIPEARVVKLDRSCPNYPRDSWMTYRIMRSYYKCHEDATVAIADNGKNWTDDDVLGENFLTTFYAVASDSGFLNPKEIFCNYESTFTLGSHIKDGDAYYIYSSMPYDFDSTYRQFPIFEGGMVADRIFYGYGCDIATDIGKGYRRNYNRIWHSHIDYPAYIKWDYYFDLSATENVTAEFVLRGNKYFATDKSIWASVGMPDLGPITGDLQLEKVVSNIGIPDDDNFYKANEEYAYFATKEGVYQFNGIRAEKISYNVDPLIARYANGRCVLGYKNEHLYVSYPDSDITLVMDERYSQPGPGAPECWYTFDFGMTCFYTLPDTNVFWFGQPNYLGYVFYYPNKVYVDSLPGAIAAVTGSYTSGWQSFGGFDKKKALNMGNFPLNTSGNANIKVFCDFSATQADSFWTTQSGRYVHRPMFDRDCYAEYFKINISEVSGVALIFDPYRLYYSIPDVMGDRK